MNVQFLNPFIEAAFSVLQAEANLEAKRKDLSLQKAASTTDEVTVLVSMVGQVKGIVLYGMSEKMSLGIVSRILDQPFEEFDDLAQSGIGELGNVITGQAGQRLAGAGYEVNISPPTLIQGKGAIISTLDFDRLVVPLATDLGDITIHLAVRESASSNKVGNGHIKAEPVSTPAQAGS